MLGGAIGGLASGLDTDAIVKQLISLERGPQIRLRQKQTIEEARQNALRDVKSRLTNLSTKIAGLRDIATWADVQSVSSSDATKIDATRTAGAAAGAYTLSVTQLARAAQQTQQTSTTAASADGTLTFQVGTGSAVTVNLTAGDTLGTIATKINGSSDIPVYASEVGGKLVISAKTTGAANALTVGGTLTGDFGFADTITPQDAVYAVNGGAPKTSASNTVTDGIAGLTLTLKSLTTSDVTVTVGSPGPDSAAIQKKIQEFVDQYNSTVDFIKGKIEEKKVAKPTSDADRTKGVLNGDSALSGLLGSFRAAVADMVTGRPSEMSYASQAGLSTGKTTGDGALNQDAISGKLSLDTAKLTEQLAARFTDVKAIFTNVTGDYSTEGLAQRLDGLTNTWVMGDGTNGALIDARIDSEQSLIDDLKKQQSRWDTRLATKEASLRKQFASLESVLSRTQNQGHWLSGQLARL
jgi:flagellar hook-associated protein 2